MIKEMENGMDISRQGDQTILTVKFDHEVTLFVPKSDYDALKVGIEDARRLHSSAVQASNFCIQKKDLKINELQAEVEILRKSLEDALEGTSAHLDNLQRYFENKCIPTVDEVNQFSIVDSNLTLAVARFKVNSSEGVVSDN